MSPNKRIFLNILATYGRSLYALALGLFSGRWVLMALGQNDFGLFGLVGGLGAFVVFLNNLLASSVGRFYAFYVGAAKIGDDCETGLEECRKWFNTAIVIHTAVPVVLIAIGYPICVWAIENFLSISADRVYSCIWVWRFTCLTCFATMVSVPFQAMYTAKQEIAELTVYSFATTTFNALFFYYMVEHPGFWLTKYAAWKCIVVVVPQTIIGIRAMMMYPECRIRVGYFFNWERHKALLLFSVAKFWAQFSSVFSAQGQSILVNKYSGVMSNAAMTIAAQVKSQAMNLASALSGAFWPAITNKAGEGDMVAVRRLGFMTCRLSSVLMLVFSFPLCLEIHEVLRLWLVNPPPFAAEICVVLLLRESLDKTTDGYWMAIYGVGNGVGKYSWTAGWAGMFTVFIAWGLFVCGMGMWSIVIGLACSKLITVGVRLVMGKSLVGFSFFYWLRKVFIPIFTASFFTFSIGIIPHFLLPASFLRVVFTTLLCEAVFLPCVWLFVFDQDERAYLIEKANRILRHRRVLGAV